DEQLSDTDWKDLPANFNLFLTLKGYYYLKFLVTRFHYFDLVSQDTPIFETVAFEELKSNFPLSNKDGIRNHDMRKEFIKLFIQYLKMMENKQSSQVRAVYGSVIQNIFNEVILEIDRA